MENVRLLPLGDSGITVEFGNEISETVKSRVTAFVARLEREKTEGILEIVPTYRSASVYYDPSVISYKNLVTLIERVLNTSDEGGQEEKTVVEIPVWYSRESGPDLEFVASHSGKTEDEVIAIHSRPEYLIYMLGFTPGFPYLGGMDESIAAPRLETPRVKIEAGSVGIAGSQTGIYSLDSPGGWRLIGKTPVKLFDIKREKPTLLESGQYLKFVPIGKGEYIKIKELCEKGVYSCKTCKKEVL